MVALCLIVAIGFTITNLLLAAAVAVACRLVDQAAEIDKTLVTSTRLQVQYVEWVTGQSVDEFANERWEM